MNDPRVNGLEAAPRISETLSEFVARFDGRQMPADAKERAKLLMLDAIGIAFASSRFDFAHRSLLALQEFGAGDSDLIGMSPRLNLRDAAMLNGILVHGLDYDDTYLPGSVHLTASSVPVALAVAANAGATGEEMLIACALGLEVAARLAAAANGGILRAGYHATSIAGVFASALAAGRLLRLNARQLAMAQGIALSMASGNMQPLQDGSWTKRMHPGWAAASGITAAVLARQGFVGPIEAYEGRFGLFPHYLGEHFKNAELGLIDRQLGEKWEFARASIKLYPACHQLHAFLNAALKLSKEHGIKHTEIASLKGLVASAAVPLICEPLEVKRVPTNSYGAQFSLPYGVACCFVRGKFGLAEVEESAYTDPTLVSLAQKVSYEIDPNSGFPKFRTGEIIVETKDGRTLKQREQLLPDELASASSIVDKFMANAESVMAPARAREIRDAILSVDKLESARTLTSMLRGGSADGR